MPHDCEKRDLKGLKCPLPALFARRAMAAARPGTLIEFEADDPMAAVDMPHMCRQEGFEVMALERDGDVCRIRLRKP